MNLHSRTSIQAHKPIVPSYGAYTLFYRSRDPWQKEKRGCIKLGGEFDTLQPAVYHALVSRNSWLHKEVDMGNRADRICF